MIAQEQLRTLRQMCLILTALSTSSKKSVTCYCNLLLFKQQGWVQTQIQWQFTIQYRFVKFSAPKQIISFVWFCQSKEVESYFRFNLLRCRFCAVSSRVKCMRRDFLKGPFFINITSPVLVINGTCSIKNLIHKIVIFNKFESVEENIIKKTKS